MVTDISKINISQKIWNELVAQNQTNTVFQTYEWFHSWWEAFGDEYQLYFIIVKDDDNVVGFAPLMSHCDRSRIKTLRFSSDKNADYCDFIIKGNKVEFIDMIIEWIFNSSIEFNNINLINIPENSTTISCLKTSCLSKKIPLILKQPTPTPTLLIKNHEAESSKIINKYSIRRHFNKLNKTGAVKFKTIDIKNADSIQKNLDHFFEQHISRYSLKKDLSLFEDSKNKIFYFRLIKNMVNTDWLLFSKLELNGDAIAYHFGFDYNGTIIWYKPSFDIKHKNDSPGCVLLSHLINSAIGNKKNEFDFTIGKEPFKKRFTNHTRHNINIWIDRTKLNCYHQTIKNFVISYLKKILNIFKS